MATVYQLPVKIADTMDTHGIREGDVRTGAGLVKDLSGVKIKNEYCNKERSKNSLFDQERYN